MPDFPATDPLFLSTLSLRRATPRPSPSCHPVWDFYPRSPCGERPGTIGAAAGTAAISIHALLAESDKSETQSDPVKSISIHALLAESDRVSASLFFGRFYFYPRSPCGERRARRASRQQPAGISIHALLAESDACITIITTCTALFLSTLSLRRATS